MPPAINVPEGLDGAVPLNGGPHHGGEVVASGRVPQGDEGAHDPLPHLIGLQLGDRGGRSTRSVFSPAMDSMMALAKSVARLGK